MRAGLLVRQVHHWAAVVFVAAILLHLLRIFFAGAFRRPREINWMVGVTMLLLAMFAGYTGYALPGDLLSGAPVRIGTAVLQSIPVIGSWALFVHMAILWYQKHTQFPGGQRTEGNVVGPTWRPRRPAGPPAGSTRTPPPRRRGPGRPAARKRRAGRRARRRRPRRRTDRPTHNLIPGVPQAESKMAPPLIDWSERAFVGGRLANTPAT